MKSANCHYFLTMRILWRSLPTRVKIETCAEEMFSRILHSVALAMRNLQERFDLLNLYRVWEDIRYREQDSSFRTRSYTNYFINLFFHEKCRRYLPFSIKKTCLLLQKSLIWIRLFNIPFPLVTSLRIFAFIVTPSRKPDRFYPL